MGIISHFNVFVLQLRRFIHRKLLYFYLLFFVTLIITFLILLLPTSSSATSKVIPKSVSLVSTTVPPTRTLPATTLPATTQPIITTTTKPYVAPVIEPIEAKPVVETIQGDWVAQCHLWASEAGIELTPSAISLIDEESDCDPNVKNPSSSACGIAQNIRGCDSSGYGRDPIQQLKWMHGYVFGKFGGWEQALAFWHCKGTCYFKGGSVFKTANWY